MSRRVEDMSDEELLALTPEDIDRLVKFKMAEEGVPIYPPMNKEPELLPVDPPEDIFYICEKLFKDILFPDSESLHRVVDLMVSSGCQRRVKDWNDPCPRHEQNILKARYSEETELEVSLEKCYSPAAFHKVKSLLKENQARLKAHTEEIASIKESLDKETGFRESYRIPIADAGRRRSDCYRSETQFKEYIDLASGDVLQAWKFYYKANSPASYVQTYLCSKFDIKLPCDSVEEVPNDVQ